MTVLLVILFAGLHLLRLCFASSRKADLILASSIFGAAGALTGLETFCLRFDEITGYQGSAAILRINCLFVGLWLIRCALVRAVHGQDRSFGFSAGVMAAMCTLTWVILLTTANRPWGVMVKVELESLGFKPSLQYVLCLAYLAFASLEIAPLAWKVAARAKTRVVAVCGTMLTAGAVVIAAGEAVRACLYSWVIAKISNGDDPGAYAGNLERISVHLVQAASAVGVVGAALPTLPVAYTWTKDLVWALSALRGTKPVWERAVEKRGRYRPSISFADPVARLHRRVVEIRDAQLAGAVVLNARERALIAASEARLESNRKGPLR